MWLGVDDLTAIAVSGQLQLMKTQQRRARNSCVTGSKRRMMGTQSRRQAPISATPLARRMSGARFRRQATHLPRERRLGWETSLEHAILDLCSDDWYGLWEIYFTVARAIGVDPDERLRSRILAEIGRLMDEGLLDTEIWSEEAAPRGLSSKEVRLLPLDSDLWGSPANTTEQLRVACNDAGRDYYFEESKRASESG